MAIESFSGAGAGRPGSGEGEGGNADGAAKALNLAQAMVRDLDGTIRLWAHGLQELYGYTCEDAIGKCSHELLDTSFPQPLAEIEAQLCQEGRWTGELVHRRRNGEAIVVASHWALCRDPDGRVQAVIEVNNDITLGKVAEDVRVRLLIEELTRREAHLQSILATVPDAMVIINENGLIQSFSATAERLFGFTADEVRGRNVSMLMPAPHGQEHDGYLARYLSTGERRVIGAGRVVVGRRKDGGTFPMELSVGEIVLEDKRQFTGFVRDLTVQQERDRLLHEVQSELLHISRLSTIGEMASALAHELNQPLSAIANYLQGSRRLLQNSPDERATLIMDAMDKAAAQAIRAGQVIQRLRDFVTRGETERRIESIRRLVEEASALALVAGKQRSIRVTFQFDPTIDLVLVDKVQIQQVLLNLMRNALEAMDASDRRELLIRVEPAADMVVIKVVDTGPGVSPTIASRLFQPFVSTKQNGMGIGLSISRAIIESHGGQIRVEPNPDGGTIFSFTLRALTPEELSDNR